MNFLKWIARGIVSRIAMMTRVLPFPAHRRDPATSAKTQVEPIQRTAPPPTSSGTTEVPGDQHHVSPAPDMERGHPKR